MSAIYGAVCAHAIIGTDARRVYNARMERSLAHLNCVPATPGYLHAMLCYDPAFISPANGAKKAKSDGAVTLREHHSVWNVANAELCCLARDPSGEGLDGDEDRK